jgi:hypothetical protein
MGPATSARHCRVRFSHRSATLSRPGRNLLRASGVSARLLVEEISCGEVTEVIARSGFCVNSRAAWEMPTSPRVFRASFNRAQEFGDVAAPSKRLCRFNQPHPQVVEARPWRGPLTGLYGTDAGDQTAQEGCKSRPKRGPGRARAVSGDAPRLRLCRRISRSRFRRRRKMRAI